MSFFRKIGRGVRWILHALGLNRIVFLRRVADIVRTWFRSLTSPVWLSLQGSRIRGFPLIYHFRGTYEPATTEYFKRVVQPGWTAVDIGADYGYFSLLLARLVGVQGRVFAFEPFVSQYGGYLLPNIAANRFVNITAVPMGLDEKTTTRNYYYETHGFHPREVGAMPTQVAHVMAFDDFFRPFGGRVDIVKIDTEGSEPRILKGMEATIAANPNIKIVIEIAPRVLERAGSSARALLEQLENIGMSFYWIENDGTATPIARVELEKRVIRYKNVNILCQRSL